MVSDLAAYIAVPKVHSPVALILYCGIFKYLSRVDPLEKTSDFTVCIFLISDPQHHGKYQKEDKPLDYRSIDGSLLFLRQVHQGSHALGIKKW